MFDDVILQCGGPGEEGAQCGRIRRHSSVGGCGGVRQRKSGEDVR